MRGKIEKFKIIKLIKNGKPRNKVVFVVKFKKQYFNCSDILVNTENGTQVRALWYFIHNKQIDKNSILYNFLQSIECNSLQETINKIVNLTKDSNNYLILDLTKNKETNHENDTKSRTSSSSS